ncbi:MAG: Chemotaxis protein methyltransferase [Syntrophus sp. SKADARSKE-3]|nr:Chemotaxis protein methyltransferase [Syntrophus sp. SKADARSKE-3]
MAFTFFFRDLTPLEHAVRFLIEATAGRSRVRIWDAGCAMGQEPYTLAILLAENMGAFAFRNVQIHATDYDEPLLKTMQEATYPWEELQRIPKHLFEKYFQKNGKKGYYRVTDIIRNCIHPKHHDLLTLSPALDGFSLIVCKNVLLHFQHHQRVEVIRMFHRALEPGGLLVMEHTQKLPEEISCLFKQMVSDSQVFRKVEASS